MQTAVARPLPPPRRHRLRTALLIAGTWLTIGLFLFSQSAVQMTLGHDPTPLWHSFVAWMVGASLSALGTPLILWLGHRLPLQRRPWVGAALVHGAFSIGYSIVQLAVESTILPALHVFPKLMTSVP